jgi:hypothetical protein
MIFLKKLMVGLSLLFALQSVFAATPWDFLRIPAQIAGVINPVVMGVLFLVSLCLFVVALLAFKKKGSKRLMLVAIAFGLFFIKSFLGLIDLYASPGIFMNFAVQGVFDLLIIGAFAIALLKK